jgi:hypothetical protein
MLIKMERVKTKNTSEAIYEILFKKSTKAFLQLLLGIPLLISENI